MPTLTTVIPVALEVLSTAVRQQKEVKGIQIGKKKGKQSTFVDNMIIYISIKNQLELINEFSKVVRIQINMQKSVVFICTNSELLERETEETIHMHIYLTSSIFIHLLLGHLGCFCLLAVVNSATMNIVVHMSIQLNALIFFR